MEWYKSRLAKVPIDFGLAFHAGLVAVGIAMMLGAYVSYLWLRCSKLVFLVLLSVLVKLSGLEIVSVVDRLLFWRVAFLRL